MNEQKLLDVIDKLCTTATLLSEKQTQNIDQFHSIITRLIVGFIISLCIVGFCLIYMTYQAYNYEGYPTPAVTNTNTLNGGIINGEETKTSKTTKTEDGR